METKYPTDSVYKRKESKYYWVKIIPYKGARPISESTKRIVKSHAETYLKERLKDFEFDLGSTRPELVTFDELAEDLRIHYRIKGRKSPGRLDNSISHLEKAFQGMRAIEIGSGRVKRYINLTLEEGAQNGTINRELSALSKMLNLGFQNSRFLKTESHISRN